MPITYPRPVGPNDRYVLFKISTAEILNNSATYLRTDGAEIVGGDPDLIYLHRREPFPAPDYDSRYRSLVVDQTPDLENGNWDTTYSTQLRQLDDRKLAVDNEETAQFYRHFPVERVAKETAFAVGLIITFAIDGQSIPVKWRAALNNYRDRVKDKILPNLDLAEHLKAQVEADQEPDLDGAPWEAPDA